MSSITLHGIGLGGGIIIAQAYILDQNLDNAINTVIEEDEVDQEIIRFEDALLRTRRELELLRNNIPQDAPAELGAFLSLNIMMLSDSQVSLAPARLIKSEQCSVEWALKLQSDIMSKSFDLMEDEYLKERKHDVIQVFNRIFKNLEGNKFDWDDEGKLEQGILVTHDLSPADLVHFKDSNFSGFVIEIGSITSHTAIIGKNLDIPAIVGVNYARQLIRDDEVIIVDGINGVLIINPDAVILNQYQALQQEWLDSRLKLSRIRTDKTISRDGTTIELYANIDSTDDLREVKYNNAVGVGLFRSEFLFLANDSHLASEQEQFAVYSKLAKTMKDSPIVIRTADLGADKNPSWNLVKAINPALGLTGIRLSLAEHNFFRTQLKAILRASALGNIQILFPMISSALELKQAIKQLDLAKNELREEGVVFNPQIKIGAMIEIPAAAFAIKSILSIVDFISIGTNDLIQYLLAIDRNDEAVNYLYNPLHPAVLKLISYVIRSSNRASVPVSLCGEMAGNSHLTRLLLGMGLRRFSMHSSSILEVKQVILNTDISKIITISDKILKTENLERIDELLSLLNEDLVT